MTKYYVLRSDGYRLIFLASIAGSVLLFLATVGILAVLSCPSGKALAEYWHVLVPLTHSGKAALAFLMGAFLWWPMNLLGGIWPSLGEKECLRWVIEKKKDSLEIFLSEALESDRLVSVSVKNGKVYIGHLISSFNPAYGAQSLTLLRSYSGHRDRETLALHIDIDYERVFEETITETKQRIREENPDLSEEELEERIEAGIEEWDRQGEENEEIQPIVDQLLALEIVIPVSEIQSVNTFDETIYAATSHEEGGDE